MIDEKEVYLITIDQAVNVIKTDLLLGQSIEFLNEARRREEQADDLIQLQNRQLGTQEERINNLETIVDLTKGINTDLKEVIGIQEKTITKQDKSIKVLGGLSIGLGVYGLFKTF